uniref:Uncharacterized protein n=1 Tax=Anguilla anguilla TaxID=7936 RepID=A0A0E9W5H3_ANGAN
MQRRCFCLHVRIAAFVSEDFKLCQMVNE